VLRGCGDLVQTLIKGEGWRFAGVLQNSNDQFIDEGCASFNQVEMAKGERVKAAWVQRFHPNDGAVEADLMQANSSRLALCPL